LVGPLGKSKHRQARATKTLSRNSPSRNRTVTGRSQVGGMLCAPWSPSAHARRGPRGARRLQARTLDGNRDLKNAQISSANSMSRFSVPVTRLGGNRTVRLGD